MKNRVRYVHFTSTIFFLVAGTLSGAGCAGNTAAGDTEKDGTAQKTFEDPGSVSDGVSRHRCKADAAFGAPKPVAGLSDASLHATLTHDELTIYFSKQSDPFNVPDDLFVAKRPSKTSPFGPPVPITTVNSDKREDRPWISADNKTLYFGSERPVTDGSSSFYRIFVSRRDSVSDPFAPPSAVLGLPTATKNVYDPFFHEGTQELWFAAQSNSSQPDYGSGARIYRSKLVNGSFEPAAPVTEINSSSGYDSSPVLSSDGLVAFISSSRYPYSTDIYTARRSSVTAPFAPPTRVEVLSSEDMDFPDWISPDNCRLYLTSRKGGRYLIYVAEHSATSEAP